MSKAPSGKSTVKNDNLGLRLSSKIKAKLEKIAKKEFRSLSQQVEKFIIEGIERYERGEK